jgi:hypothetical protein
VISFQWFAVALRGWVQREQDDVIAFLQEENRVLKAQLRGRRVRLSDPERRRLAALGHRLGRRTLADVATIVRPDTILRWHRELSLRQRTHAARRAGRPRLHAHIRSLVVRMATENDTWGYTRIQGALKNVGHQVGRSTIARILKEHGIPPSEQRPMAWRTFVRAHWRALLDFFTAALSTIRALVTYCAAFIIDLRSCRVHPVDSTPRPNEHLLLRTRPLASDIAGVVGTDRTLVCDRDPKSSGAVDDLLEPVGAQVIRPPVRAPTTECWERLAPLGGRSSAAESGLRGAR